MKQYTDKDFEEMKRLKKEFEEVGQGQAFTIGTIQRRLRVGKERATALYNDLISDREKAT
ncbi:hypothetical protein [Enterococcus mundtii]|uniref:hypothetical protein n=1 Tax=Enterococcus mundtii TaxID=53346 RepID=UPI00032F3367|nr:hypothetical protein [Enterococcus mundtii]EOH66080.1 hypothetical protein UAC_00077 [Enterococcus mundtii ATCC 882]EOU14033.1 hypothetical protein I587_02619 [Enterococcus mundtii ATCC 882]